MLCFAGPAAPAPSPCSALTILNTGFLTPTSLPRPSWPSPFDPAAHTSPEPEGTTTPAAKTNKSRVINTHLHMMFLQKAQVNGLIGGTHYAQARLQSVRSVWPPPVMTKVWLSPADTEVTWSGRMASVGDCTTIGGRERPGSLHARCNSLGGEALVI
jgi:hypothetical protein